jgi:hypothetical protein
VWSLMPSPSPPPRLSHASVRHTQGVSLALSLHAPTQELRSTIVPSARAYPLPKLMAAVEAYQGASGQKVFVEYVMLAGEGRGRGKAEGGWFWGVCDAGRWGEGGDYDMVCAGTQGPGTGAWLHNKQHHAQVKQMNTQESPLPPLLFNHAHDLSLPIVAPHRCE